jgi:hypothetical protein
MVSGDTEGTIPFTINFEDIAGHVGTEVTAVTGGSGVTFDKTRPTASIAYDTALAVKSGATLLITATFSEPLLDSPIVKIAITGGNTLAATNMTKVDADTYTYSHTVGAGNGTATVALSIGTDLTGNLIVSAPTGGATFVVDNTVPVFTGVSVLSNNANPDIAKFGNIVTAIFTTSEPLTATPTVTLGGQAMAIVGAVVGSTYTFTRTLNGTETEGDCNVLVTGTDIAGNTTTNTNVGDVQTDFTAPTGSTVTMASNNANTAVAKTGDIVTLTIITNEDVTTPVATYNGHAMTIVPGVDAQHWTATRTMLIGDTQGDNFTLDFSDIVGNAATQITAVTAGSEVVFDRTAPTLASAVRTNDTTFVVTLSELALDTTTTAANDGGFIAHETGTPGTTYAVTGIAPGATDDEVVLTVANAGASSAAGLTIKYSSAGNGNVTDLAGNEMVTDNTGVVVAAW